MRPGEFTVTLATAILEARGLVNDAIVTHGPDSLEAQHARRHLRLTQRTGQAFMESDG